MSARVKKSSRQKSMFWKSIPWGRNTGKNQLTAVEQDPSAIVPDNSFLHSAHSLVNEEQNKFLRSYEIRVKTSFDRIKPVLVEILNHSHERDFEYYANTQVAKHLGVRLDDRVWKSVQGLNTQLAIIELYSKIVFSQFLNMSEDFFVNDPLSGQGTEEAHRILQDAGIHALRIDPCADGRLSHFISYVLRLPYSLTARKAHNSARFDVAESVLDWELTEYSRFRKSIPNKADQPTAYLKMGVYHFSNSVLKGQGCAVDSSDEQTAAKVALDKLNDFRQAIENRFACGSTVEVLLIGVNTDDDTIKLHVPDVSGNISLDRFIDTGELYRLTLNMSVEESRNTIFEEIQKCSAYLGKNPSVKRQKLLSWLIENNFSQIAYVSNFEKGCYGDLGHAERFLCIGNDFDEIQLRNLSYFSYLDSIEESADNVEVGIKIFKSLNVKRGLPIPIIIRCDYDGRIPGSKELAVDKAKRLEKTLHKRFQELSSCRMLATMATLRDHTGFHPAEKLSTHY